MTAQIPIPSQKVYFRPFGFRPEKSVLLSRDLSRSRVGVGKVDDALREGTDCQVSIPEEDSGSSSDVEVLRMIKVRAGTEVV